MKAYVLHGIGDIRYEDVPVPELKPGWTIVRVFYSGICSSDIPRIYTNGTYHFPTIPGHEFSGVVVDAYDKEDRHLIGKKVAIFPLIPCRECDQCRRHHYEMCEHYDYLGSRRDGGFAEYVAVPAWNLVELPDDFPLEIAAMFEPMAVALHAVKLLNISPSDTVAIVGTGMIGFAAAQWAKMLGARQICVIGRSLEKKAICDKLGGISYHLSGKLQNAAFSKVLEAVGSTKTIEDSIQITQPGGTVVLMGNPAGDICLSQKVYWRILRKQLHVLGTWNSCYEKDQASDWSDVQQAVMDKMIDAGSLISHQYACTDLLQGTALMRDHSEPYCKVMINWGKKT